ncbi:hypothetical protein ACIRPR_10150 [Streptomyces griseoflavus]|uniref:hypothetical protein n=1 Tax=Streptomyces griseoflavus TaxID=35619 RepID=UPI003816DAA8
MTELNSCAGNQHGIPLFMNDAPDDGGRPVVKLGHAGNRACVVAGLGGFPAAGDVKGRSPSRRSRPTGSRGRPATWDDAVPRAVLECTP